ncbi:hypothetical protein ACQP25_17440 [Microtetraspora malaysiensis]|uniref:YncE family protein n=1 Tax=Microtetraspora malaysiensis TaxID=161358 RepID=UPI003D938066
MINDLPHGLSDSQFEMGPAPHVRSPQQLDGSTSNGPLATRLIRKLVAVGGALLMTAGLISAVAPAASAADSTTYLAGVTKGRDVAAGGGKVFVAADDRIIVADTHGTLTGTITGLPGAAGLAITPDSTRLYAALSGSNQVAEIDTGTLTVTRLINLAFYYPCPTNLSLSGTRLWVGYGCSGYGGVFGLDLSAPTSPPVRVGYDEGQPPLVAGAGNTLVIGTWGSSPAHVYVWDVSVTPARLRGEIQADVSMADLEDLAITADGSMAITAFGGPPRRLDGWDTTSLTKIRTYEAESGSGSSVAVALSPDGAHIAGGRRSSPGVTLYDVETAAKTYTDHYPVGELVPGSLAFLGTDVFALLKDQSAGRVYLWRLGGALLQGSALTLTAPSASVALKPFTVTGRLTRADGAAPGAQPLVVTLRLPNGTTETVPGVTTAADGTFSITYTASVAGAISYDVLWDGDADFRWSRASLTVTVDRYPTSLTLSGPGKGKAGKQLNFSGALNLGQVSPLYYSLAVQRTVSNSSGTVTKQLRPVYANNGSFAFTDTPTEGGQYTYTVQWAGDTLTLPAQASHAVAVNG